MLLLALWSVSACLSRLEFVLELRLVLRWWELESLLAHLLLGWAWESQEELRPLALQLVRRHRLEERRKNLQPRLMRYYNSRPNLHPRLPSPLPPFHHRHHFFSRL